MDGIITNERSQNAPEWQVAVPEPQAASVATEHDAAGPAKGRVASCTAALKTKVSGLAEMVWKMGADDPSKTVYGVKVGIALTLVSLFYYVRPLYDGVGGRNVVWAIMTVVLVFEYTVGGSMYKGVNRTAGTISGAALALGVHWVASKSGHKLEPFVASGSVFLLAAVALSRFIPTVKTLYDYGVTVFIMTYSFVAVSGYRVEDLAELALQRISTIIIGFVICIVVSVLVCPVWSGQDLHLLTARNMEKLADAVEGCIEDCFAEPTKRARARSEGYKSVLSSKASEDSQANLAWWEPAHGRFGFRHPYDQYAKVGAAMRHCAYCVEALDSCVDGVAHEQAGPQLLGDVYTRIGAQCVRVLREVSTSVSTMTTSRTLDFTVAEMNAAVQDLQGGLRLFSYKLLNEEPTETSLIEAMTLLPVALLLVEISKRIVGVVDAVGTLASIAKFRPADDDGSRYKAETEMISDCSARHGLPTSYALPQVAALMIVKLPNMHRVRIFWNKCWEIGAAASLSRHLYLYSLSRMVSDQ